YIILLRSPLLSLYLLPYTTLFRSRDVSSIIGISVKNNCMIVRRRSIFHSSFLLILLVWSKRNKICIKKLSYVLTFHLKHYNINLDRKSTRLNSSHVSISYAVFCLK